MLSQRFSQSNEDPQDPLMVSGQQLHVHPEPLLQINGSLITRRGTVKMQTEHQSTIQLPQPYTLSVVNVSAIHCKDATEIKKYTLG